MEHHAANAHKWIIGTMPHSLKSQQSGSDEWSGSGVAASSIRLAPKGRRIFVVWSVEIEAKDRY
jgi:hypothetical protein